MGSQALLCQKCLMLDDHTAHGTKIDLESCAIALSTEFKPQAQAIELATKQAILSAERHVTIVTNTAQFFKERVESWVWLFVVVVVVVTVRSVAVSLSRRCI
jgi:hypothetical protein